MSHPKSGSVAPPVRLLKVSPRLVLDAQLASAGPFQHIYVKVLPLPERCIEAVCAWLGREVGLPIPEPFLPLLLKSRIPKGQPWPFGEASEEYVFATLAVERAQRLVSLDSELVRRLLDRWAHLSTAAAFDQLIANDDRTEGNILLGPRQDIWLIDHTRALGGAGGRLFSTEVTPLFTNFFLHRISTFPASTRLRMRNDLVLACSKLCGAVPRIPYDALRVPDHIASQIDSYLQTRALRLQPMVLSAVGLPDLYGIDAENASQRSH